MSLYRKADRTWSFLSPLLSRRPTHGPPHGFKLGRRRWWSQPQLGLHMMWGERKKKGERKKMTRCHQMSVTLSQSGSDHLSLNQQQPPQQNFRFFLTLVWWETQLHLNSGREKCHENCKRTQQNQTCPFKFFFFVIWPLKCLLHLTVTISIEQKEVETEWSRWGEVKRKKKHRYFIGNKIGFLSDAQHCT